MIAIYPRKRNILQKQEIWVNYVAAMCTAGWLNVVKAAAPMKMLEEGSYIVVMVTKAVPTSELQATLEVKRACVKSPAREEKAVP